MSRKLTVFHCHAKPSLVYRQMAYSPPNINGSKIKPLKVVTIQPNRYHREGSIEPKTTRRWAKGY